MNNKPKTTTNTIAINPNIDAIVLFLDLFDSFDQKFITKKTIIITPRPMRMYFGMNL